jgi:hypothetical protein
MVQANEKHNVKTKKIAPLKHGYSSDRVPGTQLSQPGRVDAPNTMEMILVPFSNAQQLPHIV